MRMDLPPITVTAPTVHYPVSPVVNVPTFRPNLPNIDANRGELTSLIQLYQSVQSLDQQAEPFEMNIDFILSQLSPETQAALFGEIRTLQQQATNAKTNADRKFNEQVDRLRLWNMYNHSANKTEVQKLERLEIALSV